MQVWTYPEKRREELGATRWEVEWYTVRPGVKREGDEIDFDSDLQSNVMHFKTRAAAVRKATTVAGESFFGCATVEEQRVDWFVEEDHIAEWVGVGRPEEVAAHG